MGRFFNTSSQDTDTPDSIRTFWEVNRSIRSTIFEERDNPEFSPSFARLFLAERAYDRFRTHVQGMMDEDHAENHLEAALSYAKVFGMDSLPISINHVVNEDGYYNLFSGDISIAIPKFEDVTADIKLLSRLETDFVLSSLLDYHPAIKQDIDLTERLSDLPLSLETYLLLENAIKNMMSFEELEGSDEMNWLQELYLAALANSDL
jgi:hypothetical protein